MKWLSFVIKVAPLVMAAVHAVERVVIGAKGKDKQEAAVEIVRTLIASTETIAGRDLLNDAAVEAALRAAIDAVVALENAIANAKAAKP
jgi:hypothetical protein